MPFLYLTLVHSIEELNFYIFRITCLNNYDTVKKCSLVFLSVLLSISNDTNKKGEQTLTTAEFNERKKAEEYHRKDPEMKQFQQDYRKHVLEACKYEKFMR